MHNTKCYTLYIYIYVFLYSFTQWSFLFSDIQQRTQEHTCEHKAKGTTFCSLHLTETEKDLKIIQKIQF